MKTKLGFFGAGKMAEGILAAASLAKDFDPKSVLMAEKLPARAKELEKKYGVHVLAVRTINVKGGLKYIRGTRRAVTEATYKKAIVTVKAGERIEEVNA